MIKKVLRKFLILPTKYTSDAARIFAWKQENVPIKVICEQSGREKATIMRLLAAAKELPDDTVPSVSLVEEEKDIPID